MAKAGNNKSGLHKNISSVLKGVPIPQGVHNWRPPEKSAPGRTGDSSATRKSNISSVFKGAPVGIGNTGQAAAGRPRQADNRAEVFPADASDHCSTCRSSLVKQLDCPEDSSVEKTRAGSEPGFPGKVVRYRDPVAEAAAAAVGERMRDKLLPRGARVGKSGRTALVVSVPVLAIIAIFMCKHGCQTAPQETEASAKSPEPLLVAQGHDNEIDWKIPEPLPILTMDPKKSAAEGAVQTREQRRRTDESRAVDLRAILFSGHKPSAVVAGRIVYIGDEINGVTIADITADSVQFEKNGKMWMQSVHK